MKKQLFLSLIIWIASWVTTPVAYGQLTTLFEDSCTEAATDTLWESHTPNNPSTGASPTQVVDAAGDITVIASTDNCTVVNGDSSAKELFTFQEIPATSEYDVYWKVVAIGSTATDDPLGAIVRFQDTSNYYGVAVYRTVQSPDLQIMKMVAGTPYSLGSYEQTSVSGNCYKAEWRNAAKKVYQQVSCTGNWNELLSSDDNTISSKGKAGFCVGNCFMSGTDDLFNTQSYDDFKLVQVDYVPGAGGQMFIISRLLRWMKSWLLADNAVAQTGVRTGWVISPKVAVEDPVYGSAYYCKVDTIIDPGAPVQEGVPGHYSTVNKIHPNFNWCLSYVRGYDPQPLFDDPQIFVFGEDADSLLDRTVSSFSADWRTRVRNKLDSLGVETADITGDWTIEMVLHRVGRTLFPNFMARLNYVR